MPSRHASNPRVRGLMRRLLVASFLSVGWVAGGAFAVAAETPAVDFNREVRPILAEHCYACHGPDARARKADLRLDSKDDAFRKRKDHAVVVAGKPDESELIDRVTTDDPTAHMPPKKFGKPLDPRQVETLKRWVASGAKWDGHWSFITPKNPSTPAVSNPGWPRNDIDRFVLARLDHEGLKPMPEADKETLLRRATLDLAGLPPTLAEIDAFLADKAPDAYEKAVDRLLASPRYGEHQARIWLDSARYADTNGYHIDNHRDIWKYREWVIDAFNRDMPFDQMTVEQIAGDLLPNATTSQKVATGFHRNVMVTFEGGADPEEYLTKYVGDRVSTTATVYLGLTLACAECHDHKYDPLTQKDYYRMYAFFNTIDEKGLDGNYDSPMPRLKLPTEDQRRELTDLRAQESRLDELLKGRLPLVDAAQAKWEAEQASRRAGNAWTVLDPARAESRGKAILTKQSDLSLLASGPNPEKDVYEIEARTPARGLTAIRLEALTDASLAKKSTGRSENGNFVLTGVEVEATSANGAEPWRRVELARAEADFAQTDGPFAIENAIDNDPATGWAVDGHNRSESRVAMFVAKTPFGYDSGTKIRVRLKFESIYGRHAIGRARLSFATAAAPSLKETLPPAVLAALQTEASKRTAAQVNVLRDYYRGSVSGDAKRLRDEFEALKKLEAERDKLIPSTMVMSEMSQPRKTFLLKRGDFRTKGEELTAAVPASLPPLPKGVPANRLGLARWLVDRSNPLTARVTVNRFWQQFFGVGIVKTANDFGTQGEWPTHPELLDRLAVDFMESGWKIKRLHKMIVTSATYRQSTHASKSLRERDPDNRLLARGPRHRLDAEVIRDLALSVSGLMNPTIGGPSVYPYQPPGLWEEVAIGGNFSSQSYVQSHGNDLYRRGLYVYWKRSVPYPPLATFDAPSREFCITARPRTNTPLQALVLMNDPAFLETARGLAARVLKEGGGDDRARLEYAFRLCLGRRPNDRERAVLGRALEGERKHFRLDPKGAAALTAVGESPRPLDIDPAELAAWTAVGNILLNLDETITKG